MMHLRVNGDYGELCLALLGIGEHLPHVCVCVGHIQFRNRNAGLLKWEPSMPELDMTQSHDVIGFSRAFP